MDLNDYLAQKQSVQQPQQKGIKTTLENWLPAIGGTVGAVGAGLFSGGVGAVAGGAGGSALGEWLREKLQGEKTSAGKIATQGTIGLAAGVGGELLGAGVRGVGGLLGRGGAKVAADAGGNTLAEALSRGAARSGDTASQEALAGSLGEVLNATPDIQPTGLAKIIGKGIFKTGNERIPGVNMTKDEVMHELISNGHGSKITTAGGLKDMSDSIINDWTTLRNETLQSTGGNINIDNAMKFSLDDLKKIGVSRTNLTPELLKIREIIDPVGTGGLGNMAASDVIQGRQNLSRELGNLWTEYNKTGNTTTRRTINIFQKVLDSVDNQMDKAVDLSGAAAKVFNPDVIKYWTDKYGPQMGKKIFTAIQSDSPFANIRSLIKPYVNTSKYLERAAAKSSASAEFELTKPMTYPIVGPVAKAGAGKLGEILTTGGTGAAQGLTSGGSTLSRMLGQGVAQSKLRGSQLSPGLSDTTGVGGMDGASTPTLSIPRITDTTSSQNGQYNEILKLLALSDLEKTGGKNLTKVKQLGSLLMPSQTKKTVTQTNNEANYNRAAMAVDNLFSMFESAGGGQGLSGAIKKGTSKLPLGLGSTMQPDVSAYEQTKEAETIPILRALGEGARIPNQQLQLLIKSIPDVTDSPATVATKKKVIMNNLKSIYSSLTSNPELDQTPQSDASSLTDLLGL